MQPLGTRLRHARRRLGLTLDELAGRAGISKPYLSLIETGRVKHPPSDEKLQRLEQSLGFAAGDLVSQAHLMRTPRDIRLMLEMLTKTGTAGGRGNRSGESFPAETPAASARTRSPIDVDVTDAASTPGEHATGGVAGVDPFADGNGAMHQLQRTAPGPGLPLRDAAAHNGARGRFVKPRIAALEAEEAAARDKPGGIGVNLDAAYLSGVLQQLVDSAAGNVEPIGLSAVPVINRVSAGYPTDFTDLSYPRGVADSYVGCPDLADTDAFAARVFGDSMRPKYAEGDIVIFSPAADCRHGDDCFVRFDDGKTTFKRVFYEKDTDGAAILRLQPRNEKYRPRIVSPEEVSGLYRAMFKYQSIELD